MDYGWLTFWGPSVECLTISPVDPQRLWFGTSGHVFGTVNGGDSWQQCYCETFPDGRFRGNGLEVTCLFSIVPDPHRPGRVFFCFYDIGLLVSEDGGQTFRRLSKGMEHSGNCFTIVTEPDNPDRLWACTGEWGRNVGDVCRSDDAGETWRVVGRPETGLPVGQTKTLLLDRASPSDRRRLLVTCQGHGIFESLDGGESWHSINGNLPDRVAQNPRGLLMNPSDPLHLIAAFGGSPAEGAGVYETRDGGKTWQKISDVEDLADIQCLAASPFDFRTLYIAQREFYDRAVEPPVMRPGGLFVSHDGGRTWRRIFGDYSFVQCVVPSPAAPNVIYIGTTDHPYHDRPLGVGVLKSEDGGASWRLENRGLTCLNVSCMAVDPTDPSRLFVGTGGNGAFVGVDPAVKH
ncbi:MAG: hypothetical protein H5T86_13155 [Armatimonadetes bacterium]|nr:hypothetical protein [Armatimonadota bacterium]